MISEDLWHFWGFHVTKKMLQTCWVCISLECLRCRKKHGKTTWLVFDNQARNMFVWNVQCCTEASSLSALASPFSANKAQLWDLMHPATTPYTRKKKRSTILTIPSQSSSQHELHVENCACFEAPQSHLSSKFDFRAAWLDMHAA